jgi:hypothetical protein
MECARRSPAANERRRSDTEEKTVTSAYADVSANEGAKKGHEDDSEAKGKRYRR